jgi:hypothetical protein
MLSVFSKIRDIFSADLTVLSVAFIVFFIYGMYFGRNRLISLVLSFYLATFLYRIFPYADKLTFLSGDNLALLNKIGIFLLFFLPLTIIINRYIISHEYSGTSHMIRTAGLAFAAVIVLMLFSYTVTNLDHFYTFSPTISSLFAGESRVFWWNIAPLALLGIL